MTMRTLILASCALLVVLAPVSAMPHPNLERGFSAEKAFEVSDIDQVNLFNGNLALTIPIGTSYPVGGGFSYDLTLVLNAKMWDWSVFCADPDSKGNQCAYFPQVSEDNNAGLGFQLSLGELKGVSSSSPYRYVGADGSEHVFYDDLHTGDPADSAFYTRDGSYLRLKEIGSNREIEFSDGTIHRFNVNGRLISIRDRQGNQLSLGYPDALTWNLDDGHRTHQIKFKNKVMDGVTVPLVDKVSLAAAGSETATYTFFYQAKTIERPVPFQNIHADTHPSAKPTTATVQVLTTVLLPDGSAYRINADNGYILTRAISDGFTGMIRAIELPTKGSIEWDYGVYDLPSDVPTFIDVDGTPTPFITESPSGLTYGVVERREKRESGSLMSTQTYSQSRVSQTTVAVGVRRQKLVNDVVSPLGHLTRNYFTAYAVDDMADRDHGERWQVGVPYSTENTVNALGETVFLSREVYAGNTTDTTKLRSTYLRYERDKLFPDGQFLRREFPWLVNPRVAQNRITYHDSGNVRDTKQSSFDGLGHYRTTRVASDISGAPTRDETTNFNPGVGVYDVDAVTDNNTPAHSFTMPGVNAPWMFELFDFTEQVEGAIRAYQTYCFDATTGFLEAERRYISGSVTNG